MLLILNMIIVELRSGTELHFEKIVSLSCCSTELVQAHHKQKQVVVRKRSFLSLPSSSLLLSLSELDCFNFLSFDRWLLEEL